MPHQSKTGCGISSWSAFSCARHGMGLGMGVGQMGTDLDLEMEVGARLGQQTLAEYWTGSGTGGSEDHRHCQHQWQSHGWWDEGAEPAQSDSKAAGSQEEGCQGKEVKAVGQASGSCKRFYTVPAQESRCLADPRDRFPLTRRFRLYGFRV